MSVELVVIWTKVGACDFRTRHHGSDGCVYSHGRSQNGVFLPKYGLLCVFRMMRRVFMGSGCESWALRRIAI